MVDITHKSVSLRTAIAQAIVHVSSPQTIKAIEEKTVPKGDVLEAARIAGLFGVKKTADLIPDCHPLPIEYTHVDYQIEDLSVKISITVKTIYKTGVEVEAMHGASIIALTMYDMLKPIDKGIEISSIKLLEKSGGKSDRKKHFKEHVNAAVVICSDSIYAGKKKDKAGEVIIEKLKKIDIEVISSTIIPDETEEVQRLVKEHVAKKTDLIIFTGGTGLSDRDTTPEAILPLLDRRVPGMEEAIRHYGQERTPYSMLSRSVVGTINHSLIVALPGSTKGAEESMDAIFPAAIHVFRVFQGKRHDSN